MKVTAIVTVAKLSTFKGSVMVTYQLGTTTLQVYLSYKITKETQAI